MDDVVKLRPDENGRYTLMSGERELVCGLDEAQARRFADSLGGIMEEGIGPIDGSFSGPRSS